MALFSKFLYIIFSIQDDIDPLEFPSMAYLFPALPAEFDRLVDHLPYYGIFRNRHRGIFCLSVHADAGSGVGARA